MIRTPFLLTAILLMSSGLAFGQKGNQEGPVGIFDSVTEYRSFMGSAKSAAYGEGGSPELRAMIPMLNDIALNQPIGSTAGQYNSEGTTLGLLADQNIRRDLEMVDDQYNELQERGREIQSRAAEQLRNLDFSDRSGVIQQVREMRESAQKELNSLLLPHQLDRLRQIRFQSQVRRKSLVGILTSDPIKTDLEISDEQADKLKVAEKEIAEEMEIEMQKLREKAKNKLLARLQPKQKKAVEDMIGDAYDFSSSEKARRENQKNKVRGKRKATGNKWGDKAKDDKIER